MAFEHYAEVVERLRAKCNMIINLTTGQGTAVMVRITARTSKPPTWSRRKTGGARAQAEARNVLAGRGTANLRSGPS